MLLLRAAAAAQTTAVPDVSSSVKNSPPVIFMLAVGLSRGTNKRATLVSEVSTVSLS